MKILLLIGTGSFIGGVSRYLTSMWVQEKFVTPFPYGTLTVNIIGCFIIGLIFGAAERFSVSNEWRLFLATGICGGFTTFSAFSSETLSLLRTGHYPSAFLYVLLSVVLGLIATFIGIFIFKLI